MNKYGNAPWAGLLAAALLLAAGCSERGGAAEPEVAEPAPPQPVTLTFYSTGNLLEESFEELYGSVIRAKLPHITTKYVQRGTMSADDYIASLLTNESIDIQIDSVGSLPLTMKFKLNYDMTDLIKEAGVDLSALDDVAVEGMRMLSDGKMYGLPVFNGSRLLFYNKDLFDKFGVPYPKDGMSWDEAASLGKRMTRVEEGTQYIGLSSSKEHQIRMNALSVPLLDPVSGKPTINTDERWKSIFRAGFFQPYEDAGYRSAIEKALPNRGHLYTRKTLAMYVYPSFLPANEPNQMAQMNWDMVTEPYYSELPNVSSQVYPTYLMISNTSKHKKEAMQAIQVLLSAEYQRSLARKGQMPILKDRSILEQMGKDTPYPDKNWQAVFQNRSAPITPKSMYDYEIEKIYLQEHLSYARGLLDLNTVLRNAEEKALKYLESVK